MQGITIACAEVAEGLLAYLAKSAMFRPSFEDVSKRAIGFVEAMAYCGVIAQYSVEVTEEGPAKSSAADSGTLGDDCAVADVASGTAEGISKDGKEANWGNDTLEAKEVLNL